MVQAFPTTFPQEHLILLNNQNLDHFVILNNPVFQCQYFLCRRVCDKKRNFACAKYEEYDAFSKANVLCEISVISK